MLLHGHKITLRSQLLQPADVPSSAFVSRDTETQSLVPASWATQTSGSRRSRRPRGLKRRRVSSHPSPPPHPSPAVLVSGTVQSDSISNQSGPPRRTSLPTSRFQITLLQSVRLRSVHPSLSVCPSSLSVSSLSVKSVSLHPPSRLRRVPPPPHPPPVPTCHDCCLSRHKSVIIGPRAFVSVWIRPADERPMLNTDSRQTLCPGTTEDAGRDLWSPGDTPPARPAIGPYGGRRGQGRGRRRGGGSSVWISWERSGWARSTLHRSLHSCWLSCSGHYNHYDTNQ